MKLTEQLYGVEIKKKGRGYIPKLGLLADGQIALFYSRQDTKEDIRKLLGYLTEHRLRVVRVRVTYEWASKGKGKP